MENSQKPISKNLILVSGIIMAVAASYQLFVAITRVIALFHLIRFATETPEGFVNVNTLNIVKGYTLFGLFILLAAYGAAVAAAGIVYRKRQDKAKLLFSLGTVLLIAIPAMLFIEIISYFIFNEFSVGRLIENAAAHMFTFQNMFYLFIWLTAVVYVIGAAKNKYKAERIV